MAGGFLLASSGPNLLVWVTVDGPERVATESSAGGQEVCAVSNERRWVQNARND